MKLTPLPTSVVNADESYHLGTVPAAQLDAVKVAVVPTQIATLDATGAAIGGQLTLQMGLFTVRRVRHPFRVAVMVYCVVSLPTVTVKVVPLPLTKPAFDVTTAPLSTVTVVVYFEVSDEQTDDTKVSFGAGSTVTVIVSLPVHWVCNDVMVT